MARINNKETLLSKYNIPINHLDFDYVKECNNSKELEMILKILKSGEEGYYPDLTKATEERLALIKPKSKLLRQVTPVLYRDSLSIEDRNDIENDMNEWIECVNENDIKLKLIKTNNINNTHEIRKSKSLDEKFKKKSTKTKKTSRISSTDYKQWDKYDADTEILKIDLEEEKYKKENNNLKICDNNTKKESNGDDFNDNSMRSDVELTYYSNYEKEKGNEYFKIGDFKQALEQYTKSINIKPTPINLVNRALIYLNFKQYNKAIDDCDSALKLDKNNIKAILRKAEALHGMDENYKAYELIEYAVKTYPNNTLVQGLAETFRIYSNIELKPKRFSIVDSTSIIPIPSTSTNKHGPHYIQCDDPEYIKEEIKKFKASQIMHLVSLDNNSDDDDCCIDHLKSENNENIQSLTNNNVDHGGDHLSMNIDTPCSFLEAWNSAATTDKTLKTCADILRQLNPYKIPEIIGSNLDDTILSTIIKCLTFHFTTVSEVIQLHMILENLVETPRYEIISLQMSSEDRNQMIILIIFLRQHDKCLSADTIKKLII